MCSLCVFYNWISSYILLFLGVVFFFFFTLLRYDLHTVRGTVFKCTGSMGFDVYSCVTVTINETEHFYHPEFPLCPPHAFDQPPFCHSPFVLPVSRISCDLNHTLLTVLYLAFVEANAFEIHSCHFVYQRFVLFCCSLLFFGMDVPQFIHSPVDGHFFLDEDECE